MGPIPLSPADINPGLLYDKAVVMPFGEFPHAKVEDFVPDYMQKSFARRKGGVDATESPPKLAGRKRARSTLE